MQKLEKSLNNVHEIPRQHFNATHRQKRLHDPRAQQHSCKVGGPGLCKRQHKKEQFLPQVRSPLERPIYSHSQLWPCVVWDPDSWKKKSCTTISWSCIWVMGSLHGSDDRDTEVWPSHIHRPNARLPLCTEHSSDDGLSETGANPPRTPATKGRRFRCSTQA